MVLRNLSTAARGRAQEAGDAGGFRRDPGRPDAQLVTESGKRAVGRDGLESRGRSTAGQGLAGGTEGRGIWRGKRRHILSKARRRSETWTGRRRSGLVGG